MAIEAMMQGECARADVLTHSGLNSGSPLPSPMARISGLSLTFGLIVDDFPIASERVPDVGLVGSSSISALAKKPRLHRTRFAAALGIQ